MTDRIATKTRTVVAQLVIVVLFMSVACRKEPPAAKAERRRNVLVVTLDTTRADHLGTYGYVLARTPTIDRLAREGVRGADHASVAPITMPAHTSIMTGLLPAAHGVRDNGTYSLSDSAHPLAKVLHDVGYETHAFVSAMVLDRRYNLAQGFDTYDDDLAAEDQPALFMIRDRPAPRTADRVLGWLDRWGTSSRTPFFTWVHFFDPHQPHQPHTPFAFMVPTAYDAEIATVDEALARIIDKLTALGELDNTIIVLTADHGESLGEHGEKTHALFIYDATIKVPLIVRAPGLTPQIYDGPTSHVDIMPTVLGLLGLPPRDLQGVDLTPAFRGQQIAARPQYMESRVAELGFGMAPLYGVRFNGQKYIRAPRPELYDLVADPHEEHSLDATSTPLSGMLDAMIADSAKHALEVPKENPMTSENFESLMALGYVARPEDREAMQGIDPKDGLPLYEELEAARHAAQRGDWSGCIERLEALLAKNPNNTSARDILGLAHFRRHEYDEAKRDYEQSLAIDPQQMRTVVMLGQVALARNDLDRARELFERAQHITPHASDVLAMLGYVALRSGNTKSAEAYFSEGAKAPHFATNFRQLGDISFTAENYPEALALYERLLKAEPTNYGALVQAGIAAAYVDDDGKATLYLETAKDLRPDSWLPLFNLAWLRARSQKPEEALSLLEQTLPLGFNRPDVVESESDWTAVRALPEFQAWLFDAKTPADKPKGHGKRPR